MKRVRFQTTATTTRTYLGEVPDGTTESDIFFMGPQELNDLTADMECDVSESDEEIVRGSFVETTSKGDG